MTHPKRSLRLGIDLDGVVADFTSGWIARYNLEFDTEIDPSTVTFWEGLHTLTHFADMGEFWRWGSDLDGASIFRHLEPYEGAIEALNTLFGQGHEIVILTHKPNFAISDTYAWLAEQGLATREVHLIERKWDVDCDLYLDDADHNLEAYLHYRPDRMICRYVQPWNTARDAIIDITGWPDLFALVESSQGGRCD
jgi:5'(3')-deoxyribonucleotidase